MDFFNKLGKKASEAYKVTADKTGKLAKEAKLRMKISELKDEISDIYEEIGKLVYENHVREEKQDISKVLDEKCTKIDCLSDEIEAFLKQCLDLKDKKQCPNCYTEIEKDVRFCPQCGIQQEDTNLEETEDSDSNVNSKETIEVEKVVEPEDDNLNKQDSATNLEETVKIESDVNLENGETNEYIEPEEE